MHKIGSKQYLEWEIFKYTCVFFYDTDNYARMGGAWEKIEWKVNRNCTNRGILQSCIDCCYLYWHFNCLYASYRIEYTWYHFETVSKCILFEL